MVLRRWEIETEIYFIKRVDKGQIVTVKDLEIFHGGYLTFINSFDKINFCYAVLVMELNLHNNVFFWNMSDMRII